MLFSNKKNLNRVKPVNCLSPKDLITYEDVTEYLDDDDKISWFRDNADFFDEYRADFLDGYINDLEGDVDLDDAFDELDERYETLC